MPSLLAVRIVARWQQKARIATILNEAAGGASVLLAAARFSFGASLSFIDRQMVLGRPWIKMGASRVEHGCTLQIRTTDRSE
jgi:hypothetical protein